MEVGRKAVLTPEQSLAIIVRTLGQARRQLIMPDGPLAKVWGIVVLIGFGAMYVVRNTSLVDSPLLAGLVSGAVWVVAAGVAVWFSGRLGRAYYAAGSGVWSPVMGRLPIVWIVGVLLAIGTGLTAGLGIDGVVAMIAFFVAALYLMSGLLCFDNVEVGTGLWIGVVSALALLVGRSSYAPVHTAYPLLMAVLVGGGLVVSGFMDDRRWASVTSQPDA